MIVLTLIIIVVIISKKKKFFSFKVFARAAQRKMAAEFLRGLI